MLKKIFIATILATGLILSLTPQASAEEIYLGNHPLFKDKIKYYMLSDTLSFENYGYRRYSAKGYDYYVVADVKIKMVIMNDPKINTFEFFKRSDGKIYFEGGTKNFYTELKTEEDPALYRAWDIIQIELARQKK